MGCVEKIRQMEEGAGDCMSDDNKSEGPYKFECFNKAYAEGRKAERERCARIAESGIDSSVGELIAEKIRGEEEQRPF